MNFYQFFLRYQLLLRRKRLWHICVLVGIVFGLLIRFFGLTGAGHFKDVILVSSWGQLVASYGWTHVYQYAMDDFAVCNYPPINAAIFGAVARVQAFISGDVMLGSPTFNIFIKLPAVFADAWLSLCIFGVLKQFLAERKAIIAGLVFWLYPSIWMLSVYWGQTDSISHVTAHYPN